MDIDVQNYKRMSYSIQRYYSNQIESNMKLFTFLFLLRVSAALFCKRSSDCPLTLTHTAYCIPHTSRCLPISRNSVTVHQFVRTDPLKEITRSSLIEETNANPISLKDRQTILRTAALIIRQVNPHRFFHLNFLKVNPAKELINLKNLLPIRNFTNVEFHEKVRDIFQSMDDFHTVYQRPDPLQRSAASLGFTLSEFYDSGDTTSPRYVVSDVIPETGFGDFEVGVEVMTYNGLPVRQAIRLAGKSGYSANPAAQEAEGILALTFKSFYTDQIPSADDQPRITYIDLNGNLKNITLPWVYVQNPPEPMKEASTNLSKPSLLWGDFTNLHTPPLGTFPKSVWMSKNRINITVRGNLSESVEAEIIKTNVGDIGRLLIKFFPPLSMDILQEYRRILKLMPEKGLILDLRGNIGGRLDLLRAVLELCSGIEIPLVLSNYRASRLTTKLVLGSIPNDTTIDESMISFNGTLGVDIVGLRTALITGERFTGPTENGLFSRFDKRQQRVYNGPIIGVIDARTYSAGDVFASLVVDTGLFELVGTANATGGGGATVVSYSTMSGLFPQFLKPLPDVGVDFTSSAVRYYRSGNSSGLLVENIGVAPNVQYFPTRRDVLEDDRDLMEFLSKRLVTK